MCMIYVCCNKVKSDARLLFEAIFDVTSKGPASTYLILIKYRHSEDLRVLGVRLSHSFVEESYNLIV